MQKRIIASLEAARALFAPILASAREERLHVAHLDPNDCLIGLRMRFAARGQPVEFALRAIIGDALRLHSTTMILAHNHPSGVADPTVTDIEVTRGLVQVARPLGITVRDHLVFGRGDYVSFRASGLL